MKKSILYLFFALIFSFLFVGFNQNLSLFAKAESSSKTDFKLSSKSAILMDSTSGKIIFEKNKDERLPIASMTKLATLAIVFDALENKIIKLSDDVLVSKNAGSVKGSSAFLDAGSKYKISDLIKTVIIASANDSSVALAEHLAGSEEMFVLKMNKLSEKLGLQNTNFANCTGLPAEEHYSSAYDMVQIYNEVAGNSIYQSFSKIWIDELVHPSGRKTELVNTNRLVKTYDGIEGGKTGYTDKARFCLTASAKRGDMRLVGVVIGADSSKVRFSEMTQLFDFGFANFKNEKLVSSEAPITILKAKNAINNANVYAEKDIVKFLSKDDQTKFSTDFEIYEKKAPLKAGDKVGKMFVFDENNMVVDETNLIVREDVSEVDFAYEFNKIVSLW